MTWRGRNELLRPLPTRRVGLVRCEPIVPAKNAIAIGDWRCNPMTCKCALPDRSLAPKGVFIFPLPADAKIDDLALDVPGGFEHGAIIAKARAKKIWNGVIDRAAPQLHRPAPTELIWVPGRWKDPALLDWQHGGRVELRVFPIPAHG